MYKKNYKAGVKTFLYRIVSEGYFEKGQGSIKVPFWLPGKIS